MENANTRCGQSSNDEFTSGSGTFGGIVGVVVPLLDHHTTGPALAGEFSKSDIPVNDALAHGNPPRLSPAHILDVNGEHVALTPS